MSLLRGNDTVIVIPKNATERTKYGTWKKVDGDPITVEGVDVQDYGAGSLSGLESDDETSVNDQKVIRGPITDEFPTWPGGTHSRIMYKGVEYDQLGLAKEYNRGYLTKHYLVRIKRRSAEVK
jgi:hypothetical protein